MRLLLLLSALLTALTGVAGPRVQAQPMQASATAIAALPHAVAASSVALRFAAPAYSSMPPRRLDLPRFESAATSRLLYAERRRE